MQLYIKSALYGFFLNMKSTNIVAGKLNILKVEGCPKQFGVILEYISLLHYHQRPDYDQIENLFVAAIQRRKIDRKAPFEWGDPKTNECASRIKAPSEKAKVVSSTKEQLTKQTTTTTAIDQEKKLMSEVEQLEVTLVESELDMTQCT